jgi:putative methionine-R-sulfoxide reductase with GAF domain
VLSGLDLDYGVPFDDYASWIVPLGNKVYVSTFGSLAVISLNDSSSRHAIPTPVISAVRVFEEERAVPVTDSTLQLLHNENFFSIDFASPAHRDIAALQYSYKLDGYDDDWISCGRRLTASYTNVPPGNYTFLVRTTNAYGEWQPGKAAMRISIIPAFWQLTWFKVLCLVVLALGLWLVLQYIYHRLRRERLTRTIDYFAHSVYGENSVADICWDISRNCISYLKLEDCVVYLRDERKPILKQVAAYGPKSPHGHEIQNPIEIEIGKGIVGTVAATGKPIMLSDTRKDPRYIIDDAARLSELAVPIIHDGEVIGVIDTEHSRKGFYKEAHLKALTTIASICSNKIAEAQAEASVRDNERELLQIRSMLADSQLMALRTQMNPHFVFNSLNSIQECIVTGKYGEASHYLNKFSKLFRALLENSSKPLIPLSEEIAVLELYLSLEHMRFEGTFEYSIDVDDELEAEEIMIPSMLLQPFVENALWHGLMHKEGERELRLSFEAISSELFRCTIDDNGIGREKAGSLKAARQANSKSHISRGLQITHDRIALMQRRGQKASIRIIDKHDSAGHSSGTRLVIELSAYLTSIEA